MTSPFFCDTHAPHRSYRSCRQLYLGHHRADTISIQQGAGKRRWGSLAGFVVYDEHVSPAACRENGSIFQANCHPTLLLLSKSCDQAPELNKLLVYFKVALARPRVTRLDLPRRVPYAKFAKRRNLPNRRGNLSRRG